MVHLTTTVYVSEVGEKGLPIKKQHFCEECADAYFACTPGMNSSRGLICLSDFYRSRLYDLLEKSHPEAFDNKDTEACRRGSRVMEDFLRKHLKQDNIEVNEDAFGMLCHDFIGSHHFYTRQKEYQRKQR